MIRSPAYKHPFLSNAPLQMPLWRLGLLHPWLFFIGLKSFLPAFVASSKTKLKKNGYSKDQSRIHWGICNLLLQLVFPISFCLKPHVPGWDRENAINRVQWLEGKKNVFSLLRVVLFSKGFHGSHAELASWERGSWQWCKSSRRVGAWWTWEEAGLVN